MEKAKILDALGRKEEATTARKQALGIANAQQLYGYGRQLQREKRADEAFALYLSTAKKYPDYWLSHAGLARVYSSKGDFDNATKQMEMALAAAPDGAKYRRAGLNQTSAGEARHQSVSLDCRFAATVRGVVVVVATSRMTAVGLDLGLAHCLFASRFLGSYS